MATRSKLVSRADGYAGQAARAAIMRARVASASAASVGYAAAREAARCASYTIPTNVLTASDAGGGTATIHVAAHQRIYPVQGNIKVPDVAIAAADITGQPLSAADLYVAYDDLTLADTTPAFDVRSGAGAQALSQVGAAPGRHLVGKVSTPAAGGGATTGGGGSFPPGGGGGTALP